MFWVCFAIVWVQRALQVYAAAPPYTYTLIQSPTSCPTPLPTAGPYRLDLRYDDFSLIQTVYLLSTLHGNVSPQIFNPAQVNGPVFNFHTGNTSAITVFFRTNQSVYIDADGVRLYTADCSKELHLPVQDLVSVLVANTTSFQVKKPRTLRHTSQSDLISSQRCAQQETTHFNVTFQNQCLGLLPHHKATLQCNYSNFLLDPYYEQPVGTINLVEQGSHALYSGSCTYEDFQTGAKAACQQSIRGPLSYTSQGLIAELNVPTNHSVFYHAMLRLADIVKNSTVPAAIQPMAHLFPIASAVPATSALYDIVYFLDDYFPSAKRVCNKHFTFVVQAAVQTTIKGKGQKVANLAEVVAGKPNLNTRVEFEVAQPKCRPRCAKPDADICGLGSGCNDFCYCYGLPVGGEKVLCVYDLEPPCSKHRQCETDSDCPTNHRCLAKQSICCDYNICALPIKHQGLCGHFP